MRLIINENNLQLPKILKLLGFKYEYEVEVIQEPTKSTENIIYKVKLQKRYLYWWLFKLNTIKL